MPSSVIYESLRDIQENIGLALSFVAGFSFDQFCADRRTFYAATRCLEIISEASRRLPDEMKARHSDIRWIGMARAGNVYRHEYEDVLESLVWHTVNHSLRPLLAVVEQELARLKLE